MKKLPSNTSVPENCFKQGVTAKVIRSLHILFLCFIANLVSGQANEGSLRLLIKDASGKTLRVPVHISSSANDYVKTLSSAADGELTISHLPFGIYRIGIQQSGFADFDLAIEIRSSTPKRLSVQLKLSPITESVTVRAPDTLLTLDQPGAVEMLGSNEIQNRLGSIPGRSLEDLLNSQPGWLYEGSDVLHPRGSEYQTQFVLDGVPLTDNRSPGFGPQIDADATQSLSVYTAGIPAEFGRKMGGVVEVNTIEDAQPGLHGQIVLDGGSFDSAGSAGRAQYSRGQNSFGSSASGSRTDHYLNPVVPQNYINTGTLGDFFLNCQRAQTPNDKVTLSLRREFSRYDIPNELVQQAAGQRQTAADAETMGIAAYQHVISDRATADAHVMLRDKTSSFNSNAESTPIALFQRNGFREFYFNSGVTLDRGRHEWKAGAESDNTFLHEALNYAITDPSQFDSSILQSFAFTGSRADLEQAIFAQDSIHLKRFTISAGLRWDHYQLLLNRRALQPRVALSRYLPSAGMLIHASYDRVFQTPSSDNILLSSSTEIQSLDPGRFLRLAVEPSTGDYYELGASKDVAHQFRIDANFFRRILFNFADDNQFQNTTVAFPIAFRKAIIYGFESKLEFPGWRRLNGFVSYSYQVGNVWLPVTGGLFFGRDASAAATQIAGHIPASQDQRNTLRTRVRYQAAHRLWIAGGAEFDSGLPFEFDGDPSTVLAQYGSDVLARLNFPRGRILPSVLLNASANLALHRSERFTTLLQADVENLSNTLNVLDFGGLFSGNAIGPPRSFSLRLTTNF